MGKQSGAWTWGAVSQENGVGEEARPGGQGGGGACRALGGGLGALVAAVRGAEIVSTVSAPSVQPVSPPVTVSSSLAADLEGLNLTDSPLVPSVSGLRCPWVHVEVLERAA